MQSTNKTQLPTGKIIISVFAYECHADRGSAGEQGRQTFGGMDADERDWDANDKGDYSDCESSSSLVQSSEDEASGQEPERLETLRRKRARQTILSRQSESGHQQRDEVGSEMISKKRSISSEKENNDKNKTMKLKQQQQQQQDDYDEEIEPLKKRRRRKKSEVSELI